MHDATLHPDSLVGEAGDLDALCHEGRRSLELMDARAACTTFRRLMQATVERASEWAEVPGLHDLARRGAVGLADCLALSQEADVRQEALQSLFLAFQADARARADGLTREIPYYMLRHALPTERRALTAWVRQALASAGGDARAAEALWRLLLDLGDAGPAPMDALFAECRAAGHAALVAEKLLDMDRVGEALIAARRELQDAESFLRFASSPAAHGQTRAIMVLVAERLDRTFDPCLAAWLAARYAERGDLPRALEIRLRLLREAPGRGDYAHVEALARRLGTWERLQPEVAHMLAGSRREEARVELALGEGDLAQALACVATAPDRYGAELVVRVAEYAATAQPEQAADLYQHLLERALAEGASAEVAGYLRRLREVYDGRDALDEWEAYLEELRERYGLRIWG